ncbi:IS629, transposase orfB, truncation [Escherichia coli]|nr:IS629, transposase orfB, truncation [Escherichia coli]
MGPSTVRTVHHSDKGSQYVSLAYTQRLKEAGLLASTGSTGDSYDNAMAESINGLYKAEVIHRKSWKNRAEVELATLTWVDCITIDDCWKGWAILLRQKQKKLIMLPSETMIWQPEFTDKTLSRKPGAVQLINEVEMGSACSAESAHSCQHVLPVAPDCGAVRMHDRLHQNVDVWKLGNQTWFSTPNLSQNRTQRLIAKIDVY